MKLYALLLLAALVALASSQGLTQQEIQAFVRYYSNHQRPCRDAQFSVLTANAENLTLRTTGIPQHTAFRTSPFRAAIQEVQTWTFPREPEALEKPLCVPNGVPIGYALDGVPFYNPLSKDWNNAIEGSCAQVFDGCGGNVDKNNQYYYSYQPSLSQQCMDLNQGQEAVHIGVALDGFPIYYERRFNSSLLDECGGRYLDTANNRFYRYVVSDQFPYTLGCFRGKVQNISTLTHCKGNEGEYGKLCACVNVGPPGMAVGYKWLSKDAVTVGQCARRPVVQERARAIICNRDEIPEPDFQEEDRRSNTCVDFRALYSLIVIQGHKGGLARWTRLRNYGREEEFEEREEDNEYIRHFKALRWLLSDLDVLDYPELEKYEKMMKNKTKPLCPKEQLKLRNALAQIWVVSFLREAHKLREDPSDQEKEEVQRAFKRLLYVLNTLKALQIGPYVRKPEKKDPMDPWGVWRVEEEDDDDDDEEKMKNEEDKLGVLVSQLTALQTLGQMKEKEKKDSKKSEGGDGDNEMKKKLISLLWEIQGKSKDGKPKEMGGMGREGYGEERGNGNGKKKDDCDEDYKKPKKGMGGMRREGEEGEEEEGEEEEEGGSYGRRGYHGRKGRGMRRAYRRMGRGYGGMEGGYGGMEGGYGGMEGGYGGMEGGYGGMEGGYGGMEGGYGGMEGGYGGMEGGYDGMEGGYGGMEGGYGGMEGGYGGMEGGYGGMEGGYGGMEGGGMEGHGGMGRRGGEEEDCEEDEDEYPTSNGGGNGDYDHERGPGGDGPQPGGNWGSWGSWGGQGGRSGRPRRRQGPPPRTGGNPPHRGGYPPRRGGPPPPREGPPPPRGGQGQGPPPPRGGQGQGPPPRRGGQGQGPPPRRGGQGQGPPPRRGGQGQGPPPRRGGAGSEGQCPSGGGRDQDPRDMMRDMMDMMRRDGEGDAEVRRKVEQLLRLLSYVRQGGSMEGPGGMGGREGPEGGRGEGREGGRGRPGY